MSNPPKSWLISRAVEDPSSPEFHAWMAEDTICRELGQEPCRARFMMLATTLKMYEKARAIGGVHDEKSAPIILSEEQAQVILGALDTVATALTEHGHTWTDGERTIYEYAVGLLPHFCWSCCARLPMGCTDATCADCKHSLTPPPE